MDMQSFPWYAQYPESFPREIGESRYSSATDLLEQACRDYAQLPAFTNMGKSISYAQLAKLSDQFASYLQQVAQLQKGDRIAIQLPNILQFPIAMVGAMKAGLVIVNTNPLYTPREMEYQFKDSGAKAIVILANFAANLEKVLPGTDIRSVIVTEPGDMLGFRKHIVNFAVRRIKKLVPSYTLKAVKFLDALTKGKSVAYKRQECKMEDILFLQYTGGTTGISKGALLTHRNLLSNIDQVLPLLLSSPRAKLSTGHVGVIPLPLYHIYALGTSLLYLSVGMNTLLITNPRDLKSFIRTLRKPWHAMIGVNTLYNGMLNHPDFHKINFTQTISCTAGGMALQEVVFKTWLEKTGHTIAEGYGLSETSPVLTFQIQGRERIGSIGIPIPSTEIAIMDETGKELPYGEAGELCARGPQVFKGYWQKDNANVFHPGRWFKTGDIAVMDEDGYIRIVDRKKDMILVSGFNVYPNEIEGIVATHPKVLEVAAVGMPDDFSGELIKIFVVKKDQSLTAEELMQFSRENFTSYKCPKLIEFKDSLPKTNVGKILRRALRE
jgi:long-chain acyl-CoA synthetase